MNALENLISQPVRENAGQRTGNRYQYQYHWGLIKLLDLFGTDDDFMMIFEFADDVIVLDSSEDPKYIDFYQIKTNTKKGVYYWKTNDLTSKGTKKNPKSSIIEKLIDNYNRYNPYARNIQFVSNLPCKFDKISTQEHNPLLLDLLSDKDIKKFKDQMCVNCPQNSDCKEQCKKILSFNCSDLDINSFKETSIGKVNVFLNTLYPDSDINDTVLYDLLLKSIKNKSTYEGEITNKRDLIVHKSISKQDLQEQLNIIYNSSKLQKMYTIVHTDLSKIYSIIETKKIEKAFKDIEMEILNIDNLLLQKMVNFIRKKITDLINGKSINDDTELKEYVENIVNQVYQLDTSISNIYDKYYISAIFFREWNLYG
ncbi:MAG: DUF4297 domain-containing protein [Oscillospiraceae bacterium]|nr:DUF4297 domain-containing protein [Oscillospiraceae bacterium]